MTDVPKNVRFERVGDPAVLRVSYVTPPATVLDEARVLEEPLDLWGAAWALDPEHPASIVDVRAPRGLSRARWRSLVLRMSMLEESLDGIEFLLDGSRTYVAEVAEIRRQIQGGLLLTYDRSNLHRDRRPGKAGREAGIEEWIPGHAKKFLQGAFHHGLKRQFPAIVFKASLADRNRATTRQWVDLLGVDGEGRLSVIVLKTGDALPMGRLAEGLDHAVFCHEFHRHMRRNWFPEIESERVALYLVADHFPAGLLQPDGDRPEPLLDAIASGGWLDVVLVRIESAGLPASLSERVVYPAAPVALSA